ncbi:MAG: FKBP-type peptidyl-prolyl cis-trans isomerase [Brumimicrobium sp.]|nr:FKBP-type peptidyl-prolyl cis-trans isomerase [Brumimicrobium sp.]MCO5268923.1 FKBP-type peptidyl-prolyl cis-trans isomerase [Brumimicrobium sp.]
MNKIVYVFIALLTLSMMSCKKGITEEEQLEKDIEEIESYCKEYNLDAKEIIKGLYYVSIQEGTGNHPKDKDNVLVRYKGYTTDNSVFDQSGEEGISFNLRNVIEGWTRGIPQFKEGGSGILLIASKYAYGKQGANGIKPNTVLVFDVELLSILY